MNFFSNSDKLKTLPKLGEKAVVLERGLQLAYVRWIKHNKQRKAIKYPSQAFRKYFVILERIDD